MRRYVGFLLVMLLALTRLSAMAESDPFMAAMVGEPGSGDITLENTVAIAKEAVSKEAGEPFVSEHGMTACFLTIDLQGEPRQAWHIVLCNGARDVKDCYAATVLSPGGEVAGIDRFKWSDRRDAWEVEKGPYPLWTAEDKALFYALYTRTDADGYGDGVPGADDLMSDQAVKIAREALIAQKNADPEEMDSLMLSTWFQVKLKEGGDQADYWCVLYLTENPDSPSKYDTVYQANVASPDGEIYMLYSLHADGPGNG